MGFFGTNGRKRTGMDKQSIFGRISQLMRANVNSLIDQAEDPQLMLDQLVRDYSNSIREAEDAIAQTIGNLRMMEQDHKEDVDTAADWGRKALAASQKADQLRGQGNAGDADKFDSLAKVALGKQLQSEQEAKAAEPTIASQNDVVEKLKTGLDGMRQKLGELSTKRDQLVARQKSAAAQAQVHEAARSINVLDPTSELGRFEEKVRREEAKVVGQQELDASSLDRQFESLEDLGKQTEIEARLAALKGGELTATPTSTKAIGS
jgi:phage shock protein A